ncbi:class I lanthipeptide [Aquimarina rhabdastrellae]
MSKLKLNKKTLSILDKNQLDGVNGGQARLEAEAGQFTSLFSCKRTRRNCCDRPDYTSGCLTC